MKPGGKATSSRVEMAIEVEDLGMQIDDLIQNPVNEWTDHNSHTIDKWEKSVEVTSYVFNEALDKYTLALQRALVLALICSVLSTICAGVNIIFAKLSNIDTTWIVLACSIVSLLSSGIMVVSTGLVQIGNWNEKIRNYAQYVERLSALWIILRTELDLSPEYRIQAGDFIKRMHGQYVNLIQQGPQITRKECDTFIQSYKNKKFKDFNWNNRYGKTLEMV